MCIEPVPNPVFVRPGDPRWSKYRAFSRHLEVDLLVSLLRDLKECAENESNLFYQLLPSLYKEVHIYMDCSVNLLQPRSRLSWFIDIAMYTFIAI